MSTFDIPADTEAKQILAELKKLQEMQQKHTDAVNALGANVQWVIDNAQSIFQMFSNPAFMSMIPNMMGGMNDGGDESPSE